MRVIALSDTHMFEQDLGELPRGDVLIHAGDLLRAGTLKELERTAPWLRAQPHRYKVFVAGNHDGCFQTHRAQAEAMLGPDVIYLQDESVVIEGLKIYGSPWQPAYNDWAFNLERGAALKEKWDAIDPDTDILVTHGPPLGYGDTSSIAGRHGCEALLEAVRRLKPRLHLFGHIHNDGGMWREDSVVFSNVTTWESERAPSIFEVTQDALTCLHIPAAGC